MEYLNSGDLDFYKISLKRLTSEAQCLLSCLLNTKKILLTEGPEKLPRDWRGIARLINISSEIANSYESDKTASVLKHWISKKDDTATVGKLLDYVQKIDRYDIFDDFMELAKEGQLLVNQPIRGPPCNIVATPAGQEIQLMQYDEDDPEENIITFDDKIHGAPQFYHAYVLYSIEDRDFVDEMLERMRERGFKLCTEDDVLPDHATPYAPVSRLISSDRCYRIILVYSPEFLNSAANHFYMDYAQAVDISKMKKPKIVPCMYRNCVLPPQMTFYHKLYYNTPGCKSSYNFWDRLALALDIRPFSPPRIGDGYGNTMTSYSQSSLNIREISPSSYSTMMLQPSLLAIEGPNKSQSINDMYSVNSLSSLNLGSTISGKQGKKQKHKTRLRNMLNSFKFGKKKEAKMPNGF